jgi:hypothetical protein
MPTNHYRREMSGANPLDSLLGCAASAVCFVRDYVEIHFDGPIVRCISDPEVARGGKTVRFPEVGSRDALCELIGRNLEAVEETEDVVMEFHFEGGYSLTIFLDSEHRINGEAAHFVPGPGQPISVW